MKTEENRRDVIIDYICNISGNRVKPLPTKKNSHLRICVQSLFVGFVLNTK